MKTVAQFVAEARGLSVGPCVTLELTPGWCLAGVEVRVRGHSGRLRRIHFARGAATQRAALTRLVRDLRSDPRVSR